MQRDTLRQLVTIIGVVATILVNALANALPINGQQTGEVSDQFPVYFVPAGYVFSIWGLIYLGFAQELLRERRETTGRIDSRFKGESINPIAESFKYDPFYPAVGPAIMATFNDYYREVLKVDIGRPYVGTAQVWQIWDSSHQQPDLDPSQRKVPFANTAVDLAYAMTQNPKMRLLVMQGYFDLATPYGATDYFLAHLDIAEELRANITTRYYEAGHMMYVHPQSIVQFARDLSAFTTP